MLNSKSGGSDVLVLVETSELLIEGQGHFPAPVNRKGEKLITEAILWGLASGLLHRVPVGQVFSLNVFAEGLLFFPTDPPFYSPTHSRHPLNTYASAYKWAYERKNVARGEE